jgi:purine-binding chemotaxis protein CheW
MAQYLTFKVGNEIYGVDVASVREVINYEKVYPIPVVPDYIRGVINLRGEVVPVIDLSCRFYGRKSVETRMTSIVIMEINSDGDMMHIGVIIDAINAVQDIHPGQIEHTPEFGSKIRADFISGVGKTEGKFIILLNIPMVLNVSELSDFVSAMQ